MLSIRYVAKVIIIGCLLILELGAENSLPQSDNKFPSQLEETPLQVQIKELPREIILKIEGSHHSLPKEGKLVISLTKISGCKVNHGKLVDVQKVEIQNKAFKTEKTYSKDTLTPGIYLAWVRKASEVDQLEKGFIPTIIQVGSLVEVEKYYEQNSKNVFNLIRGIKKITSYIEKLQKEQLSDTLQEDLAQEINKQLKELKPLEDKLNYTFQEGIHLDSFGLISAMLTEYNSLVEVLSKKLVSEINSLRPGEGDWTLPSNKINLERVIQFFTQEILVKTSLQIRIVLSEVVRLFSDEIEEEMRIKVIRENIDFIKKTLEEYPQAYQEVITKDNIKPLQDILALLDNLISDCEQELKEYKQIIRKEEMKDRLKRLEDLLDKIYPLKE